LSATATAPPETGRRRLTARGTLINSGFQIGIGGINLLKSVIAAGFLTAADYGIWGIVLLAVTFVGVMKTAAIGDKYIQQDEDNQELAFQKAFTLELLFAGLFFLVMCAFAPLLALAYGQPKLIAPALVLSLVLPTLAMQSPTWVFYRRMDFVRQRLILSVDPLLGLVVTIGLAAAGFGYWSLVIGLVAGSALAGVLALLLSPIRLRLVYDHGTAREYLHYSWPLVLAAGGGIMIGQVSLLLGNWAVGLAGAGAIGLASTFAFYTDSIDRIITQTLYPAVCRVRDRRDLLIETFTKSNRLTLIWGMPFGIGLALFAGDLVHFGIGNQWTSAIVLLEVFGVCAAVNHIGFNWDAYYRAVGRTRPIAVVAVTGLVVLIATAAPLLFTIGLDGYAIGIGAMTAVTFVLRWRYLVKLFPGFGVLRYMIRAIVPTVPATAVVVVMRQVETGPRTASMALVELGVYLLVTAAITVVAERELLREALGYLGRVRPAPASELAAVVDDVADLEPLPSSHPELAESLDVVEAGGPHQPPPGSNAREPEHNGGIDVRPIAGDREGNQP
jgi:polysaccharide transporter, PST family